MFFPHLERRRSNDGDKVNRGKQKKGKQRSWRASLLLSGKLLSHSAECNKVVLHASVFSLDTVPAPFRCLRVNELALKESFKEPC